MKRVVPTLVRRLVRPAATAAVTAAVAVSAAVAVEMDRTRNVEQQPRSFETPNPDVEETRSGNLDDCFDVFEVTGVDEFMDVSLTDIGDEPVVVDRSSPRFSRLFGVFLTLCVGVVVGSPIVAHAKRRDGEGAAPGPEGQQPVDGPDHVQDPIDPIDITDNRRKVSYCEMHDCFFESVAFCPYCQRDHLESEYRCIYFDDVPDSCKMGGRLIPKEVFPPYLFDSHYYRLSDGVLRCVCGRHRPRKFTPCKLKADFAPNNMHLRFFIETSILVKDETGALLGLPVYSSYGYLEGYSLESIR